MKTWRTVQSAVAGLEMGMKGETPEPGGLGEKVNNWAVLIRRIGGCLQTSIPELRVFLHLAVCAWRDLVNLVTAFVSRRRLLEHERRRVRISRISKWK